MVLTDEEWAMVYAAMKIANAVVLEVTMVESTPMGNAVVVWRPERAQAILAAKEELRNVSELPYKWVTLMQHFDEMFGPVRYG